MYGVYGGLGLYLTSEFLLLLSGFMKLLGQAVSAGDKNLFDSALGTRVFQFAEDRTRPRIINNIELPSQNCVSGSEGLLLFQYVFDVANRHSRKLVLEKVKPGKWC